MRFLRAAGLKSLGLAAFFIFAMAFGGCAPAGRELTDASSIAGKTDLRVSPEDRDYFLKDIKEAVRGPRSSRDAYFLGLSEYQLGHYAEAGKYFLKASTDGKGSGWDLASIYMMGASLEKMADLPRAFVQYQRLALPSSPQGLSSSAAAVPVLGLPAQLQKAAHADCQRLIPLLSGDDTAKLIAYPAAAEFQAQLQVRLIQTLVTDKKIDQAFSAIEDYFRRFPTAPYGGDVETLAREADKATPVDSRVLGLLLPLSGPQAPFGAQVRQGAELALDQLNAGLPEAQRLRFAVADEGSDSGSAANGIKSLLSQNQAMGVLGPMSSEGCLGALPMAASRRTLLFSPTAIRSDLGTASPYLFRNCLTPEKQGQAMADNALFDLKVTRVAALYPDTGYGSSLMRAFAARMSELGGQVPLSLSYAAGEADFKDLVVALGGVDPTAMKDADTAEKREQQAKVEEASSKLGRVLLNMKDELESRADAGTSAVSETQSAYAPLSFPAKVAVIDFASNSSAAQLNAGRSLADRFWRVLAQLDELKLVSPEECSRQLALRALKPELLNPSNAADFARSIGADFCVAGSVSEIIPDWKDLSETAKLDSREGRQARSDLGLFATSQVFLVTVQLIDARTAGIPAWQQFRFSKLKPPAANPAGIQALYFPGTAAEVMQAASAMKFCDMKIPLLGSDLWDRPQLFASDDVSALEGARFTSGFFADSNDSTVKRFVQAYKAKYAAAPNLLSAQAFDAAMILGGLIKAGASTREELRQGLLALKNFDGVSGKTSFAGRQDAVKRVPILRINSVSKTLEQVQ
jgi:ABC-type branched-subunit amino acid transport system substrate-binding protein